MEWVETTAKTLEAAKSEALDRLGIAEEDAEFEVLDEPRSGLFGLVRGEARVRARVRPTQPRPKIERRSRRGSNRSEDGGEDTSGERETTPSAKSSGGSSGGSKKKSPKGAKKSSPTTAGDDDGADRGAEAPDVGESTDGEASSPAKSTKSGKSGKTGKSGKSGKPGSSTTSTAARKEKSVSDNDNSRDDGPGVQAVADEARAFVAGLVDAFGLAGDVTVTVDDLDIDVNVEGSDLGLLIGAKAATLNALQDVTRVASQRRLGDHDTRLRVDVGGYRVRRRDALIRFAHQIAGEVEESGVARVLEPMASADRKAIHDALLDRAGVETRSQGEDPHRRVVIAPASTAD